MKITVKIALMTAALTLACGNAALAVSPDDGGPLYTPDEVTPGPKGGLPDQAKANGRRCKGESKKHVKGQPGTDFSRCVKNMAQAANNANMAPGRVCKGESKEHVKAVKGTDFSRCVKDVIALRKEEREKEKEATAA
jgi:hypothetical protein